MEPSIAFVEPLAPWLVRPFAQVPLGPLYLATALSKLGCRARLVRLRSTDEIDRLEGFDIVAFSGTSLEYALVLEYAQATKGRYPRKSLWYGGPHATPMAQEVLKDGVWDSIGVGEGECYIEQMVEDWKRGTLQPIYYPSNPPDIDSISIPDRTLIDGLHGDSVFAFGKDYVGEGNENVTTSRGCPYDCAFCSSMCMWGRGVRVRSAKNVVDEVQGIVSDFGQQQIRFADDSITVRRDMRELCEGLRDLGCVWRCSVRADTLSPTKCALIQAGGCREVSLGLESGDQRVLDFLRKRTTLEAMESGIRNAADAGLVVRGLFMIGTPGEHPDTPERNIEFIRRNPIHCITLSTFVPLPGSPIFHHPESFNCDIASLDYSRYNRDFWVSDGAGGRRRKESPLLIRNIGLSEAQQRSNMDRMEDYIYESGKANLG